MKSIKLSIIHLLQPHQPSYSDTDIDELESAVHIVINQNLDSQADDLNNLAVQFLDSHDSENLSDDDDESEIDDEVDTE